MLVIGLCGRKGVGKNFVADIIDDIVGEPNSPQDGPPWVRKIAFADGIKRFCVDVLGLDECYIYGSDSDKNAPTGYRWEQMPQFVRDKNPGKDGAMSCRHVMQIVGTELCRDIWGRDVWIKMMRRRLSEYEAAGIKCIVITDCRFQNEIDLIKDAGGEAWRIEGPRRSDDSSADAHSSENSIDSITGIDRIVRNECVDTPETMKAKIELLMEATKHGALQ